MADPVESLTGGPPFYRTPKGRMVLGEAPIYRERDSTLHWVDCLCSPSELYILPVDPVTGAPTSEARVLSLADSVSVVAFRRNKPGSYIAAYYQGVCFLDEATGEIEVVREIIPTEERHERRFNDGGVDAMGRFWLAEIDVQAAAYEAGNLPKDYGVPKGRLWRYDPDGRLHLMLPGGLICGNGVKWSLDNRTMYLNDSVSGTVSAFDFDLETGQISNQRLLVDFRGTGGEPDGMVLDMEGNLWVAIYGTSRVMVLSPEGKRLKEIKFPAMFPTCTTWGGKNHDIIYVSTARDRRENPDPADEGGHMYIYKPAGTKGQPKHEFAG